MKQKFSLLIALLSLAFPSAKTFAETEVYDAYTISFHGSGIDNQTNYDHLNYYKIINRKEFTSEFISKYMQFEPVELDLYDKPESYNFNFLFGWIDKVTLNKDEAQPGVVTFKLPEDDNQEIENIIVVGNHEKIPNGKSEGTDYTIIVTKTLGTGTINTSKDPELIRLQLVEGTNKFTIIDKDLLEKFHDYKNTGHIRIINSVPILSFQIEKIIIQKKREVVSKVDANISFGLENPQFSTPYLPQINFPKINSDDEEIHNAVKYSINSEVAVIDAENGTVSNLVPGEYTLTASIENHEKFSDAKIEIKFTITAPETPAMLIDGIEVSEDTFNYKEGMEISFNTEALQGMNIYHKFVESSSIPESQSYTTRAENTADDTNDGFTLYSTPFTLPNKNSGELQYYGSYGNNIKSAVKSLKFDFATSVSILPADLDGYEVYSITGMRINTEKPNKGIYIIRKGNDVRKIIVK